MSMCSYCYTDGHNRRTCQELTATLEKNVKERLAAGHPHGGYAESQLAARGKGSGSSRANRKCSFCNTRGHDRRTCLTLAEYASYRTDQVHKARNHVFEKMSDQKISAGALIQFPSREWNGTSYEPQPYIGLVLDITWEKVSDRSYNSRCQILKVAYTDLKGHSRATWVSPPAEVMSMPATEDRASMSERIKAECSVVIGPTTAPDKPAEMLYKNCEKAAKEEIKDSGIMGYHSQVHEVIGFKRLETLRVLQLEQDKAKQ